MAANLWVSFLVIGSNYVSETESSVLAGGNGMRLSTWTKGLRGLTKCCWARGVCRGRVWSEMQVPGKDSRRVWVWEVETPLWIVLGLCWKVAVSIDAWPQRCSGEWGLGSSSRTEVQERGVTTVASGRENSPLSRNRVVCKTGAWSPDPGAS